MPYIFSTLNTEKIYFYTWSNLLKLKKTENLVWKNLHLQIEAFRSASFTGKFYPIWPWITIIMC